MYNKILNVDSNKEECWVEQISDSILANVLRGRGLGTYLLWKNLKKDTHHLSVRRQQLWHNLIMDTFAVGTTLVKLPQFSVILFPSP